MRVFYFGEPSEQLLGCYHPPSGEDRRAAVLLCYPGPHEFMLTHWAFRRLAEELGREGFHVLRFEYYGTGDSAGDSDAGTLARWTCDVRTAARELLDQSGADKLSIVGMRLGAALAVRASQEGLRLRDLVLWEPVVSGAAYLDELKRTDASLALGLLHHPPLMQPGACTELCGHAFSPELWRETESLALLTEPLPQSTRTYLFTDKSLPAYDALARRYGELKRFTAERVVEDEASRANLLGAKMQQAIARAVARTKE